MGATTTQGTGPGSAEGLTKGPGNNRNTYVPLLGPRIVAAGSVTTATNAATVTFENAIEEAPDNFSVLLTVVNATVAGHGANLTSKAGSTTFTGFVIASEAAADLVQWAVVRNSVQ